MHSDRLDLPTVSRLLPAEAREILRRAVAEHKNSDDFERQKALDAAIRRVRRLYPSYFKAG